jgi:hypothetical protein
MPRNKFKVKIFEDPTFGGTAEFIECLVWWIYEHEEGKAFMKKFLRKYKYSIHGYPRDAGTSMVDDETIHEIISAYLDWMVNRTKGYEDRYIKCGVKVPTKKGLMEEIDYLLSLNTHND